MKTLHIPDIQPGEHLLETEFQEQLRRALCAPGRTSRVWRQNSGSVALRDRAGKTRGRFLGAPEGAADLSGIDGSPDPHTGKPRGRRLEIEVKVRHQWTTEQQDFGRVATGLGALYVLVRYDPKLSLADNVARGVRLVDDAIAGA